VTILEADGINDVVLDAVEVGVLDGLSVLEDEIGVAIKQWRNRPEFGRRITARTSDEVVGDLSTDSAIYHWVDEGTAPTDARAKQPGGMRFRFQGRGQSYSPKTYGGGGGDFRGQVGPIIRTKQIVNRSIEARDITDISLGDSEDDILSAIGVQLR